MCMVEARGVGVRILNMSGFWGKKRVLQSWTFAFVHEKWLIPFPPRMEKSHMVGQWPPRVQKLRKDVTKERERTTTSLDG